MYEGALCAHPPNGMVPKTRERAACRLQQPAGCSQEPAARSLQPAARSMQPAARRLQPTARSMQPAACSLQPGPAAYSLQELHEHMRESDAIPNKKQ